jgi:hypothetical protein
MTDDENVTSIKTASGHPERRREARRHKDRRRDEQKREFVTRKEFDSWVFRLMLAFLASTAIASAAAYVGYKSGQDSQNGLKSNGAQATYDTCVSGAELRLAVAKGEDDLRSLALTAEVPKKVRDAFIVRTQPAIDTLLTQAAGKPYHAPLPPGTVTLSVITDVRALAALRCEKRAGATFGVDAPSTR